MAHFRTEQYAQRVRKAGQTMRLDCTLSDCPRFSDCKVIPAHGLLFGQSKAQLIFATDLTTEDEEEFRLPAIHPAGRLLRESMLAHILTKKKVPFLITKLFRANTDGKPPRVFESKLCFSHFHKELLQHTPKLVVALGMGVFSTLYTHAVNKHELPPKEEHTMASLRGKFFTFAFDGVAVRVFVAHNPGSVLQTAALYKLFKDDANTIADFFVTGAECSLKETIEIKSIERLDTVKGVFDYLDFLRYGLKESSLVAFDTETRNLNRRYNNAFLTWQFCHEPGKAVVIPIEHRDQPLFADKKHRQMLVEKMSGLLNATTAETNINFLIAHNLKFDFSVLWGLMGIIPRDPRINIPWWCTMLAAHWLDENRKGLAGFLSGSPYSLKTFGVEYFNFYFEEEALDRRGDGALEELTLDQLSRYGGSDVILTRALAIHQVNKIAVAEPDNAAAKLKKFVKHYYFPTSRALAVLECNGIYVKSDHLSYLQGEDSPVWNRMEDIEGKLQNLPDVLDFRQTYKEKIGGKVKNASAFETSLWDMPAEDLPLLDLNKQDQQKLFFLDYLRLIPLKMSRKTGQPQLNAKFLDHYANSNVYKETHTIKRRFSDYYGIPVSKDDGSSVYRENPLTLTLEYRKLKKLGTAYLDAIEGFLRNPRGDCVDSRVRASYLAHGTDTGRLSSNSPNLQQLPGRGKVAKAVKNMFQAEPPSEKFPQGTILLQCDYKTAEVRWAALFAKDRNLIKVFQDSSRIIKEAIESGNDADFESANLLADLHRRTASLMFNLPANQVSSVMRQGAKAITFGLLFGQAVKTLAESNGWTLEDGEEKLEKYFSAFPDLEKFLKLIPEVAKKKGYVETFMGRRRRLGNFLELGKLA